MDANKLGLSVILAQDELDQVRAGYAADYDMARARQVAATARRTAESESLNRIQPGTSERTQARWHDEGGGPADEQVSPLACNSARS
ncbi:hypothetical protein [Rubellimicrobium aerolatum]|uniref:TolC family protein n=1 Tax=Rubellimicrobium aerolatum TaxID=490979 RepID=A0ABW0SAF7_9RHOB|nr:hypothetical protein [Rubellimicrobium aerolatum]MBP1805239.1 hypothetical protein [Rubellimicrobium aerolatum]